jgi:hypothetical protein
MTGDLLIDAVSVVPEVSLLISSLFDSGRGLEGVGHGLQMF